VPSLVPEIKKPQPKHIKYTHCIDQGKISVVKPVSVTPPEEKQKKKAFPRQKTTAKQEGGEPELGRKPTHVAIKNQFIDYTTNISHNNYLIWSKRLSGICQMYL